MAVYNRGGFISDSFHGYYIFIFISAIFYGLRTTLLVSFSCAIVYTYIGYLQLGSDLSVADFIHKAVTRDFFFVMLGILVASLTSLRENQQKTIQVLESDRLRLKKDVEETEKRANLDGLTQIFNHRYFQEKLIKEIQNAKESGNKLSLLMIDIDKFKLVNDTYGHIKGDFILRELAAVLTKLVRNDDTIARYGGEEFIAILPRCDSGLASDIAERIRKTVEEHNFEGLKVTISVGVAIFSQGKLISPEKLVDAADKALYKAKEKRNKVFAFPSED